MNIKEIVDKRTAEEWKEIYFKHYDENQELIASLVEENNELKGRLSELRSMYKGLFIGSGLLIFTVLLGFFFQLT